MCSVIVQGLFAMTRLVSLDLNKGTKKEVDDRQASLIAVTLNRRRLKEENHLTINPQASACFPTHHYRVSTHLS
jgi:hypothetical protein